MGIERVPIEKWYPIAYEEKRCMPPSPTRRCFIFYVIRLQGPQGPQGLPGPGLAKNSRNTYARNKRYNYYYYFLLKTLLREKSMIVGHGESQPLVP